MARNKNCNPIFMFEIIVENLKVIPEIKEKLQKDALVCIRVKFEPISCFEIRQNHHESWNLEGDHWILPLKIGKSVIFAPNYDKLCQSVKNSQVFLTLVEDTDAGKNIGKTEVSLGESVLRLVENSKKMSPEEQEEEAVQDSFPLVGVNNKQLGNMQLTIRLTCLGNNVSTEIYVTDNCKYQFKRDETPSYSKCKACCGDSETTQPDSSEIDVLPTRANDTNIPTFSSTSKHHRSGPSNFKSPGTKFAIKRNRPHRRRKCVKISSFEKPESELNQGSSGKEIKFGPALAHRKSISTHIKCVEKSSFLVPRNHGWGWTKAPPEGLKWSDVKGWRPGYYQTQYLKSLKLPPIEKMCKPKKSRRQRTEPTITRPEQSSKEPTTTIRIVRKCGHGKVIVTSEGSKPEDYDFPGESDESDFELDFALPHFKLNLPQVTHKAQQFCEEDFALQGSDRKNFKLHLKEQKIITRKPDKSAIKLKKTKTKGKDNFVVKKPTKKKQNAKLTKGANLKVKPWDDWIMKLPNKDSQKDNELAYQQRVIKNKKSQKSIRIK